jgi:hypothetical protein
MLNHRWLSKRITPVTVVNGSLVPPVDWERASKCRRPHAMRSAARPFCLVGALLNPTDLVSLHLHLMHLVVALDIEASHNSKPLAAE